jgi:uncharacterized protein YeaO (DUF488 family)
MSIRIRRAYITVSPQDGARVLVDRLWPRGDMLTLLYSSRELARNNTVTLKEYLDRGAP